jgi:hypothetical protein
MRFVGPACAVTGVGWMRLACSCLSRSVRVCVERLRGRWTGDDQRRRGVRQSEMRGPRWRTEPNALPSSGPSARRPAAGSCVDTGLMATPSDRGF